MSNFGTPSQNERVILGRYDFLKIRSTPNTRDSEHLALLVQQAELSQIFIVLELVGTL